MHVIWNMKELLRILDTDEYSEFFWEKGEEEGKLLG